MAEYREVPEDRVSEFRRLVQYAFSPQDGPPDGEAGDEDDQRRAAFGDRRAMFEGDDLLVCCKHYEFEARVRGEWLPTAGLAAVASPPEHRRKGLVGEMLAASLEEYRDRDWPLAALWPFKRSFYARYGWETASRLTKATVPPGALPDPAERTGSFRRVDGDDADLLDPVYEAWLEDHSLATRRSERWWRDRIFNGYSGERHGYVYERGGEPRGYLIYTVESGDGIDDRTMKVSEFAYADPGAYRQLLRFLRDHDSQASEVVIYGVHGDRLLEVVPDHGDLTVEVLAGPMVRIVDVADALASVDYSGVEDAAVTLAVDDDAAGWNDATFELSVDAGGPSVERTDRAPDASLDVGTLSQLFVGYQSVDRARWLGELSVTDDVVAATLSELFPERPTVLPENF